MYVGNLLPRHPGNLLPGHPGFSLIRHPGSASSAGKSRRDESTEGAELAGEAVARAVRDPLSR